MRTFGLLPAAGKSRRMGRPKLTLPLGNRSVIEHVIAAVHAAGVPDLLVVVAPDSEELARLASAAGAHVLRLSEDTPDMRATCLHGLTWLEERFQPRDDDGWLLLPADHPTVRSEVVHAMLASIGDHTIVVPAHQGRRGHPTWLRWPHVSAIRVMPDGQGLNTYIRACALQTLVLDWPSDEVLCDLDTPEDYTKLVGQAF